MGIIGGDLPERLRALSFFPALTQNMPNYIPAIVGRARN